MRARIATTILAALTLAALAAATSLAAAKVTTQTASAGGLTATLSYSDDPGITTKDERLAITQHGTRVYDEQLPATGCFKVCSPEGKRPVHVAKLYGDDGEDVVLTLFTGGADCCTLADVFVPSAAVQSYVLDQHNFGEDGFVLKDIGPQGRPEFVSADPAFYCRFSACYASGLPLEIFEFEGERFIDVTRQHRGMIASDGARWLKLYYKNPAQGRGAIAAWAADEDDLGSAYADTVATVLQRQYSDHHLTLSFIKRLGSFLKAHHYDD
jgi:hypothetical protein